MRAQFIFESTGDYWPGYSDDGTADSLSDIRKKTSKIQNSELKKKEKETLSNNSAVKAGVSSENKNDFFQKWMHANMIMTSLQDGFYIGEELLDDALGIYIELIQDSKISEYLEDSKNPDYFKDTIELIITKLSQQIESNSGGEVYAPGFLDKEDEDRIRIDKRFGKYYG